jgi:peptidoglycan/LPS O-acetylase OafA/YrhL
MNVVSRRLGYSPPLDGVRGVAVLVVMIFHATQTISPRGGFIGVDVFFVLSGFLITSLIVQEYDRFSSLNFKNFYIRRFLRLGPALLLFLFAFCVASVILVSHSKAKSNMVDALIALFYVANWARVFGIHPPDYLGHTWSLSIEEQFYLLWPVTLVAMLRMWKNRWLVTLAACLLALASWGLRIYLTLGGAGIDRLYEGLDTRADSLMIGSALGIALASGLLSATVKNALSRWLSLAGLLATAVLVYVCLNVGFTDRQMYYWIFFAVELATAVLILHLLVNRGGPLHWLLSLRWIVWIGSISYGLYLWHYPIFRWMQDAKYTSTDVIIYGSLVTFVLAVSSFYLMERPLLKLKKRFSPEGPAPERGEMNTASRSVSS